MRSTSFTALAFDTYEEVDAVDDEINIDEDGDVFYDDYAEPDDDYSEYPPLTFNPVPTGHEYGVASIGWVCIDEDGEDDDDDCWYEDSGAYASVYVAPRRR